LVLPVYFGIKTYIGGVRGDISESTRGSNSDESLLELLGSNLLDRKGRVIGGLERDIVGQQTSNVGRGHGGTRDGVDSVLAANPG